MRKIPIVEFASTPVNTVTPLVETFESDGKMCSRMVSSFSHPYPAVPASAFSASSVLSSGGSLDPAPQLKGSQMEVDDSVSATIADTITENENRKEFKKRQDALDSLSNLFK